MTLCGGLTDVKSEHCEELANAVQTHHAEICEKAGVTADKLNVVHYSTQVVAGTNYFVKLQADDTDVHVHARIFKGLPHTGGKTQLHSVEAGHSATSELKYI